MVDEGDHIDPETLQSAMIPISTEGETAMVFASTINGSRSHLTKMSEMRDPETGNLIFDTLRVGKACKVCQDKGKDFCEHINAIPPWKSAKKIGMWAEYFRQMNAEDTFKQEMFNVTPMAGDRLFDDYMIKTLKEMPAYSSDRKAKIAFKGVDPSGGGNSQYSIVTITYDRGSLIITGIFASTLDKGDFEDKRKYSLEELRQTRNCEHYRDTTFVIAPEVEPGHGISEAGNIYRQCKNVLVMKEAPSAAGGKRYGFIKGSNLGVIMCSQFAGLLRAGLVQIHEDLLTDVGSREQTLAELYRQMTAFIAEKKKGSIRCHGKREGNDDIMNALLWAIYASNLFFVDKKTPEYMNLKRSLLK